MQFFTVPGPPEMQPPTAEEVYPQCMDVCTKSPQGRRPSQSLKVSMSATSLTASGVSTIGPVSSTHTLSSIRTPMPRK